MESRKESLSALKICRFCLSQDATLGSLYKKSRIPKNAISLPLKILSCVSIEVYPSDKMPSYICGRCKFFMDLSYEFKRICRQADENILQYVQTGTALESISWPSSLTKIYRDFNGMKPSNEVTMMKTVMEGGATVQVTTEELSDTDAEDEENVYNIKIGDGSDEGSKNTCIKVIAGSNKEETPKAKPKRTPKVDSQMESVVMKPRSGVEEGCWPCTQCDCTYPLQQLLELHKMSKHRERKEECDQCGAMFFNKYDMNVHKLRHSNDLMFQCAACGKKFKRLILLKRHEKLMHSEMPQQRCPHCPASFLSAGDLDAHRRKHTSIRVPNRIFECVICGKKFPGKARLQRHKDLVHDLNPLYRCDYCPQRFTSIPKLARHVRSHAAGRAYPCKYCNKTFIKSHHYTRHLRMKHRETLRSRRGPFGEVEQFRCDQCEDTFGTQDELIYHSAIHATQNLICPLCQEKFEDVEAVTMHIKSHANGSEFMCDYCELIFTTKEKLDNHLAVTHDEEVRNEVMGQDESSMDAEEDDDDNAINIKEEDGEMVVEIKKADEFMLSNYQGELDEKMDNTVSEDSEVESTYTELSNVDPMAMIKKISKVKEEKPVSKVASQPQTAVIKSLDKSDSQTASILRKAEEMKRKVIQQHPQEAVLEKKEKTNNKVESTSSAGGNDKSLRLLEKELQELKRTNTRTDPGKTTAAKSIEAFRNRRPQIHTSTPKIRNADEKKSQQIVKLAAMEKRVPERRVITKENKEPKEVKDNKNNNDKDKERSVSVVKNGTSDKPTPEEGVRRSTRPSKIKDYAKMIRESTQCSDGSDDDSDEVDDDDEEFKEIERIPEPRPKLRRSSAKQSPAQKQPTPTGTAASPAPPSPATAPASSVATPAPPPAAAAPRKRGRPRKDAQQPPVPNKIKKEDSEDNELPKQDKPDQENLNKPKEATPTPEKVNEVKKTTPERAVEVKPSPNILVSPTGHTLKKVPVKALPPGVKPLPLPVNARLGSGELCEMQIGKKVVKVQKIVMTKAEVEAMAKKGLVEMKDGTMVLKQGIKLPQQDPMALKSSLVEGEPSKESPSKKDKATPTRCDFGEDAL